MESKKPKTRMVSIGTHVFSCLSVNDFQMIAERRWHTLHARAQEMLEDARAEPQQRVDCMKELYALRDEGVVLAFGHAQTLDGAIEVIELAASKAKVDVSAVIREMQPTQVIHAAYALFSIDLSAIAIDSKEPRGAAAATSTGAL